MPWRHLIFTIVLNNSKLFFRASSAEKKFAIIPLSQIIAYFLMINEHFCFTFFESNSIYYFFSVCFGRVVFPLFLYSSLQSFFYTSNKKKYIKRLFFLALISEPIYFLFFDKFINVIFFLLYGCLIFKIQKRYFIFAFIFNFLFYFFLPNIFFTGLISLILCQKRIFYFFLIPVYAFWSVHPGGFVLQFLGLFFIFLIPLNQKFYIPHFFKFSIYPLHLFLLLFI